MKSLQKLDLRTARLLHSGQSISSVSSIVKEIVENSLDAGATNVVVKLVDYGLDRIEVIDNGHGVAEDDLPLLVLPGYTSKIRSSEDLLSLATYGFRGQALSAVTAVSRVTVASGPQDSGQGLALSFDLQGNTISRKVLPWNGGTRVTVEDVFKNIPVRRKHMDTLKAKSAQLKKVQHFLHAVAIACPGVGFSLHHNKSVVWTKVPVKTMREAIGQVYGINTLQVMQYNEAHDNDSGTTIRLFTPAMCTGDKEKLPTSCEPDKSVLLVNGRPVYIKEVTQLLLKEFSVALGAQDGHASKHPTCVVSIEVPPSKLDVNLEPDKTAVAFARKDAVFELLEDIVKKAFSTAAAKGGCSDLIGEGSTTGPIDSQNPPAQTQCQSNLEAMNDGLDHLFDDFEMPDSVCEDLERQTNRELPATPDGNKENVASFAEKTVAPPPCEPGHVPDSSGSVPEVQTEKTATPTKRPVAPLRVPERQASLWSIGILQNSQGRTVAEPTRVGGGSVAEKRPMISPVKERTPCKKMRMLTKPSGVQRWLKDVLGTQQRSAKEVYCARKKREILSQVPEMPLMELSNLLEEGWTSLTPEERQNYEKQAGSGPLVCNKPASEQQPTKDSGVPRPATSTWKKVELQFSMKALKECFEDYCHLSQQPPSLDTTLVGPLQGCPGDAWVVWHKARLCTLNTTRLREAVTFRRLVATFPLSSEEADPPISITPSILGGDLLWNRLLSMKKESRDKSGILYVTDPLLTCNGFHVRIVADCKAEIMQLPKDQALSELVQILKLVSSHQSPTVATCRLPRTVAVLREEATRMVRNMAPKMSRDEINELLAEEQDLLQVLCVHNRPVCMQFFDMSTSVGSVNKDSLSQQTAI
ncbi:PMS1 protein homolog 1-like [Amblyomma americanum]